MTMMMTTTTTMTTTMTMTLTTTTITMMMMIMMMLTGEGDDDDDDDDDDDYTNQQVHPLMYLHLEKEIHKLHKCTCPLVGNLLKTKEKQLHLMSLCQDQTKILQFFMYFYNDLIWETDLCFLKVNILLLR